MCDCDEMEALPDDRTPEAFELGLLRNQTGALLREVGELGERADASRAAWEIQGRLNHATIRDGERLAVAIIGVAVSVLFLASAVADLRRMIELRS